MNAFTNDDDATFRHLFNIWGINLFHVKDTKILTKKSLHTQSPFLNFSVVADVEGPGN